MENEKKKGKFKAFWSDFKKFISKGNIVDLAVAVVIGAAFNKIVSSLVNDIIMPLISLAVGGASVTDWKWVIKEATYDANGTLLTAETSLNYGVFIQAIIDFLIIAFTLFVIIKILSASTKRLEKMGEEIKTLSKKSKKHKKGEQVEETSVTETTENVANETATETADTTTNETIETEQTEEENKPQEQVETSKQVESVETQKDDQTKLLEEIRDLLKAQTK